MCNALPGFQMIGFKPVEEVAPCGDVGGNVDRILINYHIHVLNYPSLRLHAGAFALRVLRLHAGLFALRVSTSTSFLKNGVASNAVSTRVAAFTLLFCRYV